MEWGASHCVYFSWLVFFSIIILPIRIIFILCVVRFFLLVIASFLCCASSIFCQKQWCTFPFVFQHFISSYVREHGLCTSTWHVFHEAWLDDLSGDNLSWECTDSRLLNLSCFTFANHFKIPLILTWMPCLFHI